MLEIVDSFSSSARIKVLGVGGGGSNAVNRMIQAGLTGVEFWVANTDLQALEQSSSSNRLQIGRNITRGLGAGGDPEIGRLAAEEDRESLLEVIQGADMLFVTAGMGGGTGTGGAPVAARIARELGVLTVAIVTKPFSFEGKKKQARAEAGLAELAQNVDTLIAIPNQKLLSIVELGTPFRAAMLVADEVLFQATRGISDLITGHGEINLDFADVKTVMRNRGNALLGCGVASGKDRAIEAAQAAVSSPLLEEVSIAGAEALLINVQGGPNMGLHEAAEAAQFIADRVGEEADVFWGAVVDPSLEDEMRVTLIATGFTRSILPRALADRSEPALRSEHGVRPEPALRFESRGVSRESAGRKLDPTPHGRPDLPAERWMDPVPGPVADPLFDTAPASLAGAGTSIPLDMHPDFQELALPSGGSAPPSFAEEPMEVALPSSWNPPRDSDEGLFLAPVEPERTGSVGSDPRQGWGRVAVRSEPAEEPRWRARVMRPSEDPFQEPRLGRRNLLDEPTFMRKRMD